MKLRLANLNEAEICYQCIEDARAYHKSLGFEQWHPDYPTEQTILDDIAQNIGYVFVKDNEIIGYCCIIIGDEPAYAKIDGAWKSEKPYAVVHRMAFSSRARGGGLSRNAFQLVKDFCRLNCIDAIRLDTQEENKVMQHILSREGFEYCGLIQFDGGPKLAYEWDRSNGRRRTRQRQRRSGTPLPRQLPSIRMRYLKNIFGGTGSMPGS